MVCERRHRDVVGDAERADHGVQRPVGRHEAHPEVHRTARREPADVDGVAVDLERSVALARAEQHVHELLEAGAEQPGDAEHLAAGDVEVDAADDAAGDPGRAARSHRPAAVRRSGARRSSRCPMIISTRSSTLVPATSAVPARRPSRSTVTRSQTSRTSSRSWVTKRTLPPPRRCHERDRRAARCRPEAGTRSARRARAGPRRGRRRASSSTARTTATSARCIWVSRATGARGSMPSRP